MCVQLIAASSEFWARVGLWDCESQNFGLMRERNFIDLFESSPDVV